MTKKVRTILFLIFLFLFLLIAPSAIFYSQGYRFDFENKTLTQTGGFFLKAGPKQVEIYIDGKLAKKTDFFFGSALVENLLPKRHKIEVKKEKYLSWEKTLEIREKEVTEVKDLVLFPENLNFNILTKETETLWFSPDGKKTILLEEDKSSSLPSLSLDESSGMEREETGWALKLYDLGKNIKSHLISETEIYQNYIPPHLPPAKTGPSGADLLNLEFSEDSKEIYLDIGLKEQEKYFLLEVDRSPSLLKEREMTQVPENILAAKTLNNDSYYLDNLGDILKNGVKLNEQPFPVQSETKYTLEIFQDFLFLVAEGENLYLFSPNSKSFEKFFERINDLKISPDNKKLVFFSNSEIWILFLKEEGTKKAGEKSFLVRLSEKIGDVFWLNSDYLIFNSGNNLKIVEIDDRDRINVVDVAEFGNPKIFWSQFNKKVYVLSDGNLYQSGSLLP